MTSDLTAILTYDKPQVIYLKVFFVPLSRIRKFVRMMRKFVQIAHSIGYAIVKIRENHNTIIHSLSTQFVV